MLCAWILNQKYLWLNDFYLWISLIWSKNGLTWLNIVLHSFNIPLFLHHVELTKICMKNKRKGRRYSRITYPFCAVYCFSMLYAGSAYCMNYRYPLSQSDAGSSVTSYRKEALRNDTLLKDGTKKREKQDFLQEAQKPCKALGLPDSVDMMGVYRSPYISLQQNLKGQVPGLYIQEPSGEPGTQQAMFLRGTSVPLFSKVDAMSTQPAVYVNGVPIIENRAYSYSIKNNDVNPLGTATNLLAGLHLANIESIEVIKDPYELAKLGPLAANGAIWIVTRDGYRGGPNVTVDASLTASMASNGDVRMTNANDERNFRAGFYPEGTDLDRYLPAYLKDRTDPMFFGVPGWAEDYYNTPQLQYNVNASVAGGKGIANYLFAIGTATNEGMADNTDYSKYNIDFYLNMMPVKGLTVSTILQATKASRSRNNTLRDRYAEMEYFPSLSTPLPPTQSGSDTYLSYLDDSKDDNDNIALNGSLALNYLWRALRAGVSVKFDYETDVRNAFWPTTVIESMNFTSNYSAYNRRFIGDFYLGYDIDFTKGHKLSFDLKGAMEEDRFHYNYTRGYDGNDDMHKSTSGGGYKVTNFLDQEVLHFMNSSLNVGYRWRDYLSAGVMFRYDGVTSVHPNHKWLFTPAANLNWNLKHSLMENVSWISDLALFGSWARIGRYLPSDRYGMGPQSTSENIGWSGSWISGSYNQYATATRPYTFGWIGFGVEWPYADKAEWGIRSKWLKNRLSADVSFYSNRDKNLLVKLPVAHEYGYDGQYKQGMEITNRGVELLLAGVLVNQPNDGWQWSVAANFAFNHNELSSLPDGLQQAETDGRLLKVGEAVDRFYVLENNGIYQSDAEVPVKDGRKMTVNGVELKAGDPKWVDKNGDNKITDEDKVLKGHSLPKYTGGFSTQLKFKRFDLGASFFFAAGQSAMNYRAYQQYDFTTLDKGDNLAGVKEIFFWQSGNVPMDYPRYNALSEVHPYRADQDLYLEKVSYLKLRSVTLGYSVPTAKHSVYVYVSGNNLFTVTNFSGDDPELVDFDGYYRGYGMGIPRSVTLGVRCSF